MSEMFFNIVLRKNSCLNEGNNFFNMIHKSGVSESVFNKLNKYLLRKEIEFDNVFTEDKKDDKDENIICANFIINNLLNILNKKDINFHSEKLNYIKDDKTEAKKIDEHKNNSLDITDFLKNVKNLKKNTIEETFKTLQKKSFLSKPIQNKNQFNQINDKNTTNMIKNLHLKKLSDQFTQKGINISHVNKKHADLIKYIKKNKSNVLLYKNINKINSVITRRSSLQIFDRKEHVKSNIELLFLNNSKNSIEWKKLISHKILLSISHKDNQAEIHLKPESLGIIHIFINMKNNAATLKFVSKYNEVRTFLDSYMPFLRHSLIKNGIKLENFDICSSLKNKKSKNHNNLFYKNIYDFSRFIKHRAIDIYV